MILEIRNPEITKKIHQHPSILISPRKIEGEKKQQQEQQMPASHQCFLYTLDLNYSFDDVFFVKEKPTRDTSTH